MAAEKVNVDIMKVGCRYYFDTPKEDIRIDIFLHKKQKAKLSLF